MNEPAYAKEMHAGRRKNGGDYPPLHFSATAATRPDVKRRGCTPTERNAGENQDRGDFSAYSCRFRTRSK